MDVQMVTMRHEVTGHVADIPAAAAAAWRGMGWHDHDPTQPEALRDEPETAGEPAPLDEEAETLG